MKTETLDGGTEGSVKKEEILEPSISNHGNSLINTPEVKIPIKEEEADDKDFLCKTSTHFSLGPNNTLTDCSSYILYSAIKILIDSVNCQLYV